MRVACNTSRFLIKRVGLYNCNIVIRDTPLYFNVSMFSEREEDEVNHYWLVKLFDVSTSDEPIRVRKMLAPVSPLEKNDFYIDVYKNEICISEFKTPEFWVDISVIGGMVCLSFIGDVGDREVLKSFVYSTSKKYPINEKFYNYRECVKYINEKYNININDYYGKFRNLSGVRNPDAEYYSFWHKLLDRYGGVGEDGGFMFITDGRNSYTPLDKLTIKITDLFLAEFGEGEGDDIHVGLWVEID